MLHYVYLFAAEFLFKFRKSPRYLLEYLFLHLVQLALPLVNLDLNLVFEFSLPFE